jgi:hypothetical protein
MTDLRELVAEELAVPVDPRVAAFAENIASRHGDASRAVLFYGSCLRQRELDGLMLDFYLIVSDYRAAFDKRWLAFANARIPPNVFYAEHGGLVAKYAVLSESDFRREMGKGARSPSVWARFAQPSRLVWTSDDAARDMAVDTVALAAPTLFDFTLPMMTGHASDPLAIWRRGFELTFGAELRAERAARPGSIVDADATRYQRFAAATLAKISGERGVGPRGQVPLAITPKRAARWWKRTQLKGKALSVARLAKASLTFAGGADYIAWKINRHAGTKIQLTDWQRRHPLIAALQLVPKLIRSGAIR